MGRRPGAEETLRPRMGEIDQPIDRNEHPRLEPVPERPCRADGHNGAAADAFQRIDIGAVIDAGRRRRMAASVARKKRHGQTPRRAEQDPDGAPHGVPTACQRVRQRVGFVHAAAADDADATDIAPGHAAGPALEVRRRARGSNTAGRRPGRALRSRIRAARRAASDPRSSCPVCLLPGRESPARGRTRRKTAARGRRNGP